MTEGGDDFGSDGDEDDNVANASHLFATIRKRYADRASMLLPASEYYPQYSAGGGSGYNVGGSHLQIQNHSTSVNMMTGAGAAGSSSQTPLSILLIALSNGSLECYLNGRYRIASGLQFCTTAPASNPPLSRVQMACSNDLCHILVVAQSEIHEDTSYSATAFPRYYSLFSVPTLAEQRYTLQALTALYSSIMGHLHGLPTLLTEVIESWKSSLKPLDTKLETLSKLLHNYGLPLEADDAGKTPTSYIRKHLVRYILSGHTASSADLSNAMDQFFTGVQMNE